jgi:uncharacterized protein (TIGR02453 family)
VSFDGFPKEGLRFLADLEAHNERAWFKANKQVFDRALQEPMDALVDELGPGKVFRIYRDVRFSRDKSPYKTWMAATVDGGYVSLTADSFSVATGAYILDADALTRFRDAIVADASGRQLEKIAKTLVDAGYDVGAHETLKTAPRGYPRDHPREELLRRKGIYAYKSWPTGKWLQSRGVVDRIKSVLKDAKPLNMWLAKHVGEITHPER